MPFSRCLAALLIAAHSAYAADTRLVRETEALTAAQEQTKLHGPPGFTVQLFASEPMINKPINMAFDARGRLWVSSTVEYPYSADKSRWSDEKGTRVKDSRDAIKILEDTDGDGQADKVTDFADGLNIPTGVLPWHKPEHKAGCIAWSIPNIWYFADTDGDDKADVREVLFGPLGYEKDTHGMCSSFRLGLDGWVYATHGFNNTSRFEVKAERWKEPAGMTNFRIPNDERSPNVQSPNADSSSLEPRHSFDIPGRRIELHSGNVFRFKPDGSRVEKWTSGQVNPFGLAWDRYGNLYSADCHSSPIYQLIRGACYPSFGKPHDGLGFAPVMCEHSHGSTGICGIVYIDGGVWGPEWDDHTFVGNCVTSRVNHDKVTFTGSTPKANEQPDFLSSDDPWFRPVDLQLGPDNALYIADFYNKIIGHYEVPLEHPGRDKERGRIWRVVNTMHAKTLREANLESRNGKELAQELRSPNLNRRALATELMVRRREVTNDTISPVSAAHSLWIGARLGKISTTEIQNAMNTSAVAAAQGFRVLGALSGAGGVPGYYAHMLPKVDLAPASIGVPMSSVVVIGRVQIDSATGKEVDMIHGGSVDQWTPRDFVEYDKARIECMGLSQDRAAVLDLVKELESHPGDSTRHLTVRIGLRRLLSQPGVFKALPSDAYSAAEVVLAVSNQEASQWLWRMEESGSKPSSAHSKVLGHISRHGDDRLLQTAIHKAHANAGELSIVVQLERIQAIHNGLSERGAPPNPELLEWAQELATQLLTQTDDQPEPAWISTATADYGPKWSLQTRKCADGTEAQVLQSMIKGGGDEEKRIGVLKSKTFTAPAKLTFWINGHRGPPKADAHDKNLVRVVDAKSGETLASMFPPRNDVCQRAEFDLSKHAGKVVRLEIVDGDDGKAYAWLGITRIEPAVLSVNDFQTEDSTRHALKTLAVMLQHTAPAALREKLAAHLPPRPAPPPLPVSPEQRKQLDALIATRAAAFGKAKPDAIVGKTLFKTHCAVCHQIGGEGGLIGPQLDGIGARGAERLCEDILDPNRNVDAHFHLHTLTLKDGSKMSGFLKGEAGQVLILSDAAGQEHRVPKNELTKDEPQPMSLMPPVFGQIVSEGDFANLLGFLLMQSPTK